jgi:hypothetical protein
MRGLILGIFGLLMVSGCEKTIDEAAAPVRQELRAKPQAAEVRQTPPLSPLRPEAA